MDAHTQDRYFQFRFHVFLWTLIGWLPFHTQAAEPTQKKDPETVYVAVEQARIFAGPSKDFYPTGEAKRGSVLEVHHRTNTGWLGVRPPKGSFSWVPASQAYLLPGGRVIEITDANAVSWIGTEFGSAKQFRWQVQLNTGEQLNVMGEATIKNGSDDRDALWYRVAPPAGEFRWIQQSAVSKTPPPTSPSTEKADASVALASVESPANVARNSEVKAASFEGAVAATSAQAVAPKEESQGNSKPQPDRATTKTKPSQSTPNRNNGKKQPSPGNEWDGWYAFEMSEQGVQTPFLDKLSGRDRGNAPRSPKPPVARRDPLIDDPFSLTMTSEPAKQSPPAIDPALRQQREWRDPRSLRNDRSSDSTQSSFGSLAIRSDRQRNLTDVQSASAENLRGNVADRNVTTSGFESNLPQPTTSQTANVNWYGLPENPSNAPASTPPLYTATASSMNVVTSTADVAELQLALNEMVASSIGPWNLAPLADRARYLIEHGPTAIDRGQARLLMERIEAFQNVSTRSQQLAGNYPVQPASFTSQTSTQSLPGTSNNYDATGWLVPVHAAGPDQPTHALTNDTGDILAYVSPIAGLNLDRYRNQAVGITGLRGYLPQLQAAHIQAQRVSRIR